VAFSTNESDCKSAVTVGNPAMIDATKEAGNGDYFLDGFIETPKSLSFNASASRLTSGHAV
jgi:hypothetical protein